MSDNLEKAAWGTGLSASQNCEDWPVMAHEVPPRKMCRTHDVPMVTVKLRRIGWLDQKGNVWISEKAWINAGGPNGSLTPLLISSGCD